MPRLIAPPRLLVRESLALRVVVAQLEGAIHQLVHIDFFADHLADGERLALVNEIAAAQFFGRDADGFRDAVHVAFERENALRRAESAEGAVRRHVGGDGAAAHANVGAEVRAGGVDRPA